MTYLSPVPKLQFLDANGNPLAGGKLYSYAAGTTTPQATYTDSTGGTPNANPVILDSRGEASVWLSGSAYKLKLTNSLNEEIWTVDQVAGNVTFAALAASGGSAYIGFLQAGTGAVARTTQSKLRDFVSVKDFGAVGDGVTDDWAAFQAAHDSLSASNSYVGGTIYIPSGTYYLSQTWAITKRVTIQGTNAGDQPSTAACLLKFAANTNGIRLYSNIDSPTGTGADYSRIIGIGLTTSSKLSTGIGIYSTCVVKIEHCIVRSFASHGIYINGKTGAGATGIADGCSLISIRSADNGGDGFRLFGNDSNVCILQTCEASANGGYGYYDAAVFPNTYIACQASGNTTAPYWASGNTGNVYVGCYTEITGSYTSVLDNSVVVIGGIMAAPNATLIASTVDGTQFNCPNGTRFRWLNNGVEIGRLSAAGVLSGFTGVYQGTATDYTNLAGNVINQVTSTSSTQDRVRFDVPAGRAGSIQTTGLTTAYNTSSDYRLKENVLPMTGALEKIKALNPVTYTWKADKRIGQGFIAHELQALVPDCVSGKKDDIDDQGNPIYQGVDVSFLVATIVKAIQEQQEQIDALRSEVSK